MSQNQLKISFEIISDSFPVLKENIKEYDKHCVTYLIHNDRQIYVGETSNLRSRFKDHTKSKNAFKLVKSKIIFSEFFSKSAVYDIESRLINYMYADRKFELINIKKEQSSHHYYLKDQINDQLFKNIWNALLEKGLVSKSLHELENNYLFKYSPFKEFSENQIDVIQKAVELVSTETEIEDIGFDGSIIKKRAINQNGSKTLITGGPGTGKTLLIVKIIHDLVKRYGITSTKIAVCIPQSNLLKTFQKMFRDVKIKVQIIKPIDLSKVTDGHYDLLIVDEGHRLKQHFSKQTKDLKHLNAGKITEFEYAQKKSKNLIFMYDSKQTVRPADINEINPRELKSFTKLELTEQFRVKKGFYYLQFLEQLLQISEGKPDSGHLGDYEFKVVDDIKELHQIIKEKNNNFGLSRMASGYFKKWISKKNSKLNDFEDEGLKLPWNTTTIGWVHSANAINEVGCIHTLQGEDLNYAGIIIGDEIYLDPKDNKIKIRKENYFDQNGTPVIGTDSNDIELTKYIKNIYYVLLSRGMSGTYIYVKDKHLKNYIKTFL
jgi:DUF2075 family protein/predicted GIY-YIG superfamily endonuclease